MQILAFQHLLSLYISNRHFTTFTIIIITHILCALMFSSRNNVACHSARIVNDARCVVRCRALIHRAATLHGNAAPKHYTSQFRLIGVLVFSLQPAAHSSQLNAVFLLCCCNNNIICAIPFSSFNFIRRICCICFCATLLLYRMFSARLRCCLAVRCHLSYALTAAAATVAAAMHRNDCGNLFATLRCTCACLLGSRPRRHCCVISFPTAPSTHRCLTFAFSLDFLRVQLATTAASAAVLAAFSGFHFYFVYSTSFFTCSVCCVRPFVSP